MTHPTRTPRVMNGQSRTADKFVVRLEDGLRDRIAVLARAGRQSMNAYMISALNEVVTRDEDNVVEKRTPIGKDMPCMFNGEVAILLKTYFNNGLLTADVVTAKGEGWSVLYDTLQPY